MKSLMTAQRKNDFAKDHGLRNRPHEQALVVQGIRHPSWDLRMPDLGYRVSERRQGVWESAVEAARRKEN